ncbi:MAG: AraC family transcriptional regulator [Verrucomicrobiae bacterium]|nr:AraC family transcriptional regulator [Verrucomicrobiae bacterium]
MALPVKRIYKSTMIRMGTTLYQTAQASGGTPCPPVLLRTLYDVRAGPEYHVRWGESPRELWVLVRTFSGEGRFVLRPSHTPISLTGNTLLLLSLADIREFQTVTAPWLFWWLDFSCTGKLALPVRTPTSCPLVKPERRLLRECLRNLVSPRQWRQREASALLSQLICHYTALLPESPRHTHPGLTRIVEDLRLRLDGSLTVEEMARQAGLSPRRFRDLFMEMTGLPPKAYYDHLRLSEAAARLRMGASVKEIAADFGFSSPFHFSRMFKKKFGTPPSRLSSQPTGS